VRGEPADGEVTVLGAEDQPLVEAYDVAMFDLDGVVYVGDHAVSGAPGHLARAREAGTTLAFITNNASRPPAVVAEKLSRLGVPATAQDVVTSAQAAARLLVERHGSGATVAVLGAAGLEAALEEVGLVATSIGDPRAVAVVSGYGPDVPWRDIMRAAVLVREGLPWVASNTDHTLPTPDGVAPGHGVLVEMVSRFAGVEPVVAGKPQRPLLDETVRRAGGERPLMVGDRLDTDIEGGRSAGIDTLLVLTGVTGLEELADASPHERPTYLAPDLGGLFTPHGCPANGDGGWSLGGWVAAVDAGALTVSGSGGAADWWRVVAAAAWDHRDRQGAPPDTTGLVPPATDVDG
jgi:glycerol 3-phosphatase-2